MVVGLFTFYLLFTWVVMCKKMNSAWKRCLYAKAGMCTRPFRPRPRRDVASPRRYKLPRYLVKSTKQSPQVAAYRDNWSGIRANHVAFIIRAFCGLVNAVVITWIVCDTGFCRVLVCCWCCTATAGSDLYRLLFNSLSLAQYQLIFYLIVT